MRYGVNHHATCGTCGVKRSKGRNVMALDTLGARVLHLRRIQGLRQGDVQRAGGPSRSTLTRIEGGEYGSKDVSEATLNGLASALRCHRHWLETGTGKIWVEGVIPPEGGDELHLQALVPNKPARPELELGRHITDGPTDWAIVAKAVDIVETTINEWSGGQAVDLDINRAEAYRLIYKHLSQQKDPFEPIPYQILNALLQVAG
jgi:transcriptional regulator with XRE-family HTH domain